MSRAAANGDPSMDEILASIRKIIAEEPAAGRPVLEPRTRGPMPTPPAPPEKAAAESIAERPSAMFGRLAEALRGTRQAAPGAPRREPSGRAEDDLSDLIEAGPPMPPAPGRGLPAGPPPASARVSPSSAPPAPVKVEAPSSPRAKPETDTWTGAYPRRASQQGEAPREGPVHRAELSPAVPPPTVKIPAAGAQPKEPAKLESPQQTSADAAKDAKPGQSSSPAAASATTRPPERQVSLPNGGFMPPATPARPAAGIPVKPQVIAAMPPPAASTPPNGPAKPNEAAGKPSASSATPPAAGEAAAPAKASSPTVPPAGASPAVASAAAPLKSEGPKPSLPASATSGQSQSSARGVPDRVPASRSSETTPPAGPLPSGSVPIDADTSAAAASALGALAAGLAASSSKAAGGVLPEPPPLPPLSLPPLAARLEAATPLPPALPASAAPHQPRASTSLEALVADLLQPMLRQWLADNLPRVVEDAVRAEVAAHLKGGLPPRG